MHEHGPVGRLGQQAERAGGAERLLLAQVLDPGAEPAAVAEMVLDHVARGSRPRGRCG